MRVGFEFVQAGTQVFLHVLEQLAHLLEQALAAGLVCLLNLGDLGIGVSLSVTEGTEFGGGITEILGNGLDFLRLQLELLIHHGLELVSELSLEVREPGRGCGGGRSSFARWLHNSALDGRWAELGDDSAAGLFQRHNHNKATIDAQVTGRWRVLGCDEPRWLVDRPHSFGIPAQLCEGSGQRFRGCVIGKVLEMEGLRVRRHLTFWDEQAFFFFLLALSPALQPRVSPDEQAFGGEDFAHLLKVLTPATEGKMLRVLNDTKDVGVTGCFSNGIIQGGSRERRLGAASCRLPLV